MSQGLSEYVTLALNLEQDYIHKERDLLKEYEKIKHRDVRYKATSEGIFISGLEDWE